MVDVNKKSKIVFYIANSGCVGKDLSAPNNGNPGIGGTQFVQLCIAYYLTKDFSGKFEVIVVAQSALGFPPGMTIVEKENAYSALKYSKESGANIFVYRHDDNEHDSIIRQAEASAIKLIAWAHNTPYLALSKMAKSSCLKRFVAVGDEQRDMLRDHPIFSKSEVIYNPLMPGSIEGSSGGHEKIVTYLGAITPYKGFHRLARVWKEIIKSVPDAKLHVIGSGNLYFSNQVLGKWNIAEENYEKKLRRYLSDEKGNILDSVFFEGILGDEKKTLLKKSAVSVANPTGESETFCSCAVEMQACGSPVVSAAEWGLLTTVKNGLGGYLVDNDEQFISRIVELLNDRKQSEKMGVAGREFVISNFHIDSVIKKWVVLLDAIVNETDLPVSNEITRSSYRYKWLREDLRKIKQKHKVLRLIPSLISFRIGLKWLKKSLKHGSKRIFN